MTDKMIVQQAVKTSCAWRTWSTRSSQWDPTSSLLQTSSGPSSSTRPTAVGGESTTTSTTVVTSDLGQWSSRGRGLTTLCSFSSSLPISFCYLKLAFSFLLTPLCWCCVRRYLSGREVGDSASMVLPCLSYESTCSWKSKQQWMFGL